MDRILTSTTIALVLAVIAHAQAAITASGREKQETDPRLSWTFKATLNDQTEGFTGKLAGDQLTVWTDRQGPPGAVAFKRVKN